MKSFIPICLLALVLSACATSQTKHDPSCTQRDDNQCESSTKKTSHDHTGHVRERP